MAIIVINDQRFLANDEGQIVRQKIAVSSGFVAQEGQQIITEGENRFLIENSGFEVDELGRPTGNTFTIDRVSEGTDSGLPSIQQNVVEGAAPLVSPLAGAIPVASTIEEIIASRAAAQEDLRTSAEFGGNIEAAATGDPFGALATLPGELSGEEKLRREAIAIANQEAQAAGVGTVDTLPAPQPFSLGGPPKTSSEIFGGDTQTDFAAELGVFSTPPPKQSRTESASSFALRLASFRQNEAKKAFNALTGLTLGQIEAQKTRNLFQNQFKGPTFGGVAGLGFDDENFKTKAQIITMADDPDRGFNEQFQFAVQQLRKDLTKRMKDQIKDQEGTALRGKLSKASREALKKDIRATAQSEFDEDFADQKEKLDFTLQQAKDSFIENITDFFATKVGKGVEGEKTNAQLIKQEEDRLAKELFEAANAQGVAFTRAQAQAQAKKMLGLKALNRNKTEQLSELNELFVSGGIPRGGELEVAHNTLKNYKDAVDWINTIGLDSREAKIQKAEVLSKINPNRSRESIQFQVDGEATTENLLKISNGEITDINSIGTIFDGATETERRNTIKKAFRNPDLEPDVRQFLEEAEQLTKPPITVEDLTFSERKIYSSFVAAFEEGGQAALEKKADDTLRGFEFDLTGARRAEVNKAFALAQKSAAEIELQNAVPESDFETLLNEANRTAGEITTVEETQSFWKSILDTAKSIKESIFGGEEEESSSVAPIRASVLNEEGFEQKLDEVSGRLGLESNDLLKVFQVETAGTFDPSIQNPKSTATGIIQFTRATAEGLGTTIEKLKGMTGVEQLDFVEKFLANKKDKIENLGDLYLAVFQPAALGEDDDFVIGSGKSQENAEHIADINQSISKGKDVITVADVRDFINVPRAKITFGVPEANARAQAEDFDFDTLLKEAVGV